jgi:hypothetical protein
LERPRSFGIRSIRVLVWAGEPVDPSRNKIMMKSSEKGNLLNIAKYTVFPEFVFIRYIAYYFPKQG